MARRMVTARLLSSSSNSQSLAAFRRLMRARAALFRGDEYALDASRAKLREEFQQRSGVTDARELDELLAGAAEVEELLRENVVQGTLNERGNYAFNVKGSAAGDGTFADHGAEPIDELDLKLAEAELERAERPS